MKELRYSTKAKKDLKRYRNNPHKMNKLYKVLALLIKGIAVPETFQPHKLTGQYKGCLECHIEEDFLLIWVDEKSNFIDIIRLGTHSELF
ncbi:MAG: type II toxin-antitoxin system YafQ family toxin [Tannerellaceae bacterium]|jgi:mRNA interferase YafQ|nr:type II toxin-antitoxin system YafQ family toxin [Tannerellaceae bacterium]